MGTINGLPAHILLVHAIVVLLPLAALLLVLTAVSPSARRRFAGPNALLALIVVGLVPVTTSAGEWLESRVDGSSALHNHTELGDTAIWVALPVAALALAIWWRHRETTRTSDAAGAEGTAVTGRTYLAPASLVVTRVIAALAIVVATAAVYDTYRIGDSGAKAAWSDGFSSTPAGGADRPSDD